MADPLSVGASIIAFVQIADRLIGMCKYWVETIKDAPKEMQMILGEATSLKAIMESLKVAKLHPSTATYVPSLFKASGPVEACRRCLIGLENLLPSEAKLLSLHDRRRGIGFAELAWPLKESRARKFLAEISYHKATLLLAITGDMR